MRKSDVFLTGLTLMLVAFLLTAVDAASRSRAARSAVSQRAGLVRDLDLTDMALFTEARYTRHPSQADLHSAFQDHPFALDHFPSGSLVIPYDIPVVPGNQTPSALDASPAPQARSPERRGTQGAHSARGFALPVRQERADP